MRRMMWNSTWKAGSYRAGGLALMFLTAASAFAGPGRDVLVLTSTNNPSGNDVVVFKLQTNGTPSLQLVTMLPTGGNGGAGGNGGSLQFNDHFGAVANYGSNSVSQLLRAGDFVSVARTIPLATGCLNPGSVALTDEHLFVAGANCAESRAGPSGKADGAVKLADSSAGQIVVGKTWAAVTMKSGSVVQLPLNFRGGLNGLSFPVTLPAGANDTPLGAAFWGDILGFNPAHSPDSFALVNKSRNVFPVLSGGGVARGTPPLSTAPSTS